MRNGNLCDFSSVMIELELDLRSVIIIKRLISLVLTLILALSSVNMAVYAQEQTAVAEAAEEEVVADERYEQAAAAFVLLKVFEKAPEFNQTLTREEFAKIIQKAMKLPVSTQPHDGVFVDVPGKYKESPYIAAATDAGVFIGRPGDMFRPHDYLTEDEAVIALVNAAGYREKIKMLGDELSTYLTEAKNIGVTKDVAVNPGERITYEKLLIMMYNAFSADMLVIKEFKGNEAVYAVEEDVTLFSELYDVYEDEGIVIADEYTYLDRGRFAGRDSVVIDNGEYEAEYDASLAGGGEFLGMSVSYTYFIDEATDRRFIIGIEADDDNKILEISSYDINEVEPGKVWYEVSGGRRKDVKILDSINVIYNGVAFAYADEKTFFPDYGKLKFIDNNSDNKYDVVFVENYTTITVWGVDKENLTVYPDNSLKGIDEPVRTNGVLLPDYIKAEDESLFEIEKDGKKTSLARIKKGDAVIVMQSDVRSGSVLTKLIASSKKVPGQVEGMEIRDRLPYVFKDENDNETKIYGLDYITVNGESYRISGDVMMLLEFGFAGEFLVDAFGNIAGWTSDSGMKSMYSYLINIGYDEENNRLLMRMLYENGIYTTEYFEDEIRIDNVKFEFGDVETVQTIKDRFIKSSINTGVGSGGVGQPLKITFKTNGMVRNVETLLDENDAVDTKTNTDALVRGKVGTGVIYKSYTGVFDGLFGINTDTIVFQIKKNAALDKYNPDHFSVAKNTSFDNDGSYNVTAYDMTPSGYAPIVVAYYSSDLLKQGGIMIVDNVQKVWNEEESTAVTRISGKYHNGQMINVDAMPGTAVGENVSRGDVIIANITKKNKLYNYRMVFDNEANTEFTDKLPGASSSTSYIATSRLMYGYVESVDSGFFTLNYGSGTVMFSSTGAKVYVYDGDQVRAGSMDDIVSSNNRSKALDKVVVYASTGRVRAIYVYKGGTV